MRPSIAAVRGRCLQCSGASSRLVKARLVINNQMARPLSTSSIRREAFKERSDGLRPHHGPRAKITNSCSELSGRLEGTHVVLGGWLFSQRRASEKLAFFTLRDSSATVQLVSRDSEISKRLLDLPLESVVLVEGTVQLRKQKAKMTSTNGGSSADEVEIDVGKITLLNPADKTLPFYPNRPELANEDLRAQYRYLDLRRTELADNLQIRSRVGHLIRCQLHDQGFTEVETPLLLHSSPEGAREFLVPTRVSSSAEPSFYALPQSPQQPKQLLVSSGSTPRYFQIAKCFRDEDGRKDRQPEFTQIDLEMAFVSGAADAVAEGGMRSTWSIGGGEVREVVEGLIKRIWKEIKGVELESWFRVMPYDVAMDVYGSDKPDTRFEMYTLPLGYYPALSDSDLDTILLDESPSTVEFLVTPASQATAINPAELLSGNSSVDYVRITSQNVLSWPEESPLTLPMKLRPEAGRPGGVQPGDIIWLARRKKIAEGGWTQLGRLRVQIMEQLVSKNLMTLPTQPHFLWITQFPLFTRADEDKEFQAKGRWSSTHHPFTAPMFEDLEDLKKGNVEAVRGQHYDLVLDGQEIGGGSVRIHDAHLQEHVMRDILKLDESEISRFSHLLQALKFGAPPHGGIALGFDRLVAILCGVKSIREVIAFPKTGTGVDPVFKSPSKSNDEVLRDYGLRIRKEE
ncbi:aspartyl-tRNA synthetase, partial [Tremellales sp. Uapishka_1]